MATVEHAIRAEELMAYVDAELPLDRRAAVDAHLPHCAHCQGIVAELEHQSKTLTAWQIEPPPDTLRAPVLAPANVQPRRTLFQAWHSRAAVLTFGVLSAAAIAFSVFVPGMRQLSDSRAPTVAAATRADPAAHSLDSRDRQVAGGAVGGGAMPLQRSETPSGPKIVRTVSLTIVSKDFDAIRPTIDRVLTDVGGFVGQMELTGTAGAGRSLRATLRIPAARLEGALQALRNLGQIVDESQSGDDVTEQMIDIEARLANARNTEKRLNDVLLNRTGKVGDVLEVERELARVRGEIEQFDAQRVNLNRRVTYATVTVQVGEQRKATLEIGPQPLSGRLRNAFIDGVRDALDTLASALISTLRVAPTLLIWLALLWWPARFVLRVVRTRGSSAV